MPEIGDGREKQANLTRSDAPSELQPSSDIAARDVEKALPAVEAPEVPEEPANFDIVDWDGPDDPAKPLNWPAWKKWKNVFMVSTLTLLTPFGSSMFAPAIPQVMQDFHSDNTLLASFTVSIYVLGYAFGPLIIAPMSELYGRLRVYHVNTLLFLLFNIACAFSTSLSMEIGFRFLAGFAGVSPLTVGSGTIADLFKQEERGKVMAMWTLPILLGPTLGPVVGSYLGEAAGWRWDFHFLSIATSVMFIIALIVQDETYNPTLLSRKKKKLQKETGNMKLRSKLESSKTPLQFFLISIIRPTKMLLLSPIVFGFSLYIAICYGYLYVVFTTVTELFEQTYGISHSDVGLTFLGIGVGQFLGLCFFGSSSDKMLKKAANGGEMKPEYRLPPLLWGGLLMPAALLLYGWSAEYRVHWMVPIIGTTLVGLSLILIFMPIGTYLVDAFTTYAASAMAANTVLRSLGGAFLPLGGGKLYDALGYGWGNSLLAFIALGMWPIMWIFMKNGEKIRTHKRFQLNL